MLATAARGEPAVHRPGAAKLATSEGATARRTVEICIFVESERERLSRGAVGRSRRTRSKNATGRTDPHSPLHRLQPQGSEKSVWDFAPSIAGHQCMRERGLDDDDLMLPNGVRIGGLQAYLHRPSRDTNPEIAVVCVHQCSALGGCALAVEDVASSICSEGLLVVSFDLRGAGNSRGCCCMYPMPLLSGCPEVSDVVAVCAYVREELGRDTWICGVSAGGPVGAGAIGALESIRGYTSVAYTLGIVTTALFAPQTLRVMCSKKPKLFIMGGHDMFTSVFVFKIWMAIARQPRHAVLVPAAGHFDLEYRPLARLDGRLVAQYIAANGSLPARLDEGAVHLADARQWLCASLCTGGPLCLIIFLVVVVVVVPVLS